MKDPMDRRSEDHWHLSKSVSISQIISIILLAVALMTAWSDTQKSIDRNAIDIEHMRELQRMQDARTVELKNDIGNRLERFERKLDTLISNTAAKGSK